MNEHEKIDYYLAQVAAFIERFRQGFMKDPREVTNEEMLLKFRMENEEDVSAQQLQDSNNERQSTDKIRPLPPEEKPQEVETGPQLVEDPKWARVNENAKAVWAARFGIPILEQLNQPNPPPERSDGSGTAT